MVTPKSRSVSVAPASMTTCPSRLVRTSWRRRSATCSPPSPTDPGPGQRYRLTDELGLEDIAHSRLHLARLPQPAPNGPVEGEERTAGGRVLEVVVVGQVEYLDDRLQRALGAQRDRLGDPEVPGEVGVVAADRVSLEHVAVGADALARQGGPLAGADIACAADLRGRLGRIRADPVVQVDLARQHREHPRVDAVPLIPVAIVVLLFQ